MEFLTPGLKIKKIRKELNMTQQELIESGFTRNYISMIECDKRKLNTEAARKIVKVFRNKAKSLNIELDITDNEIMLTQDEQIERYCLNELNKVGQDIDFEFLIKISIEHKLNKALFKIYIKKADYLYNNTEYVKAFSNYLNALNLGHDLLFEEQYPYIFNNLGRCKYMLMDYENSIMFYNKAYEFCEKYSNKNIMLKVLYNLALNYIRISESDKCLIYINKCLNLCSDKFKDEYKYSKLLKAICFQNINENQKAIDIYNEILIDYLNDAKLCASVYSNLAGIYFDMEDCKNSLKYYKKSQELREKICDAKLCHTLINKSIIYLKLNQNENAKKDLKSGIKLANLYNDSEYLTKAYMLLEELYVKTNNKEKLFLLYDEYLQKFGEDINDAKVLKIYIKFASLNLKQDNFTLAKKILCKAVNEFIKNDVEEIK